MKLTKDLLHELFEYKEGKLYWKINQGTAKPGVEAGSYRANGYRHIFIKGKRYLTHRLIYFMHYGKLPDFIDHINGARDDNRIENLRPATLSQNQHNSKIRKDNTSGVKGVNWHKASQKWQVLLKVNGKQKYFGCYSDLGEAAIVAQLKRIHLHKEYARNE